MRRAIQYLFAACLLLVASAARGQLTIEITGGGGNQIPVAVLQFAGEAVLPASITDIIEADLLRSGRFRTQYAGGVNPLPTEPSQVNFGDWKARNTDAIVIGGVQRLPDGRFEVRFRLLDVPKQAQLAGMAFTLSAAQVRMTAHRIADLIYEKLTGERGVFSTNIAYVVKQNGRFELRIADADGQGAQVALASHEPIISPSWSPDGTRLAYVSFESKKPVVYVHSLASGQRHVVANFRGSNSAPAWSPDGKQLAAVLSKEGGSQIYLINADGSNVRRITESESIDTEPFFSADGQFIYFTSDRGGSPQIYRMPAARWRAGPNHLRRRVQCLTPPECGRKDHGLRVAARRSLPARGDGSGEPAGADSHRHAARRIAELCAQRHNDSLRHRGRRSRGVGSGVGRRAREAAPVGAGGGCARARVGPIFDKLE